MRRLAVATTLFALLTLGVAAASGRTYVATCGKLRVRPHTIILTCADAGFQLHRLHWRRWGPHRAFGRGRALVNDCDPFCAAGHFHRYRIRVKLGGGTVRCGGRRAYRMAKVRFVRRHPAAFGHAIRWPVGCY